MQNALKRKTRTRHESFDEFVGIKLRLLRVEEGDSQESVGKFLDVSFQQIQKYENGANQVSLYAAYHLARHYNVPINYFTDGYGEDLEVNPASLKRLSSRATLRMAQLYNQVDEGTRKAILNLLNTVVAERKGKGNAGE